MPTKGDGLLNSLTSRRLKAGNDDPKVQASGQGTLPVCGVLDKGGVDGSRCDPSPTPRMICPKDAKPPVPGPS